MKSGTLHPCPAIGCGKPVQRKFLMCGKHWGMVPPELQLRIYRSRRLRQANVWKAAAHAAVGEVARQEGHVLVDGPGGVVHA